jgi:hypothetical protein
MKITPILFTTSFTLAISAFASPDLSKLPPPAKKDGVTYAKDIRPIFESSCFGCHGQQRQRGGLRLDSLESVLKGGKDGMVIVPSKSDESKLVLAVARVDEKSAMPPRGRGGPGRPPGATPGPGNDGKAPAQGEGDAKGPGGPNRPPMGPPAKPLATEQVALIRAWVDQGAK